MGCLLGRAFFVFSFSFLSLNHAPALKFLIIIWRPLATPCARLGDSNEWLATAHLSALKTMLKSVTNLQHTHIRAHLPIGELFKEYAFRQNIHTSIRYWYWVIRLECHPLFRPIQFLDGSNY